MQLALLLFGIILQSSPGTQPRTVDPKDAQIMLLEKEVTLLNQRAQIMFQLLAVQEQIAQNDAAIEKSKSESALMTARADSTAKRDVK